MDNILGKEETEDLVRIELEKRLRTIKKEMKYISI